MGNLFKYCASILVVCTSLAYSQVGIASVTWVGQATYPSSTTTGTFDAYNFGGGIALIDIDSLDGTFNGYFQTYVSQHELAGSGVNVSNLMTSGSGIGFELTMAATFSGTSSLAANQNVDFAITAGTAGLYFDDSPDYSFASDSGFNDGVKLLEGSVTSGTGSIIQPIGVGVSQLSLNFSGLLGYIAAGVYDPDTVSGGDVVFSLITDTSVVSSSVIDSVADGNNTVLGHSATPPSAFLVGTDGGMTLSAVPVPAAFWLFGSAAIGLVTMGRNRKI